MVGRHARFSGFALIALWLGVAGQAHGQCSYTDLVGGTTVTTAGTPATYRFNQTSAYYAAVALRPAAGENWDLAVYDTSAASPTCISTSLAMSSRPTGVDFVIGDFSPSHDRLKVYYPRATRISGAGQAAVEWDDGPNALTVNAPLLSRTTGATDVIEVWDVFLTAGTNYTFTFAPAGGSLKMLLFKSAAGVWWAGRDNALWESATTRTYTPASSGYYGVVVINDDGAAGTYGLGVGRCDAPATLDMGVPQSTLGFANRYFEFDQNASFWMAVGVRGTGADWNVNLYSSASGGTFPACMSGQSATSQQASPVTDFVVGNFNNQIPPLDLLGVRAYMNNQTGTGSAQVEWDNGSTLDDIVIVNGAQAQRTTDAVDVLECWDIWMDSGVTYYLLFDTSGADLKMFLMPPGMSYGNRSNALFTRTGSPAFVPYVAASTGWHGLVVVNENGATGSYTIQATQGALAAGDGELPAVTALSALGPNPTRGKLQIQFALREAGLVELDVIDIQGRRVAEIESRRREAGRWSTAWTGRGSAGQNLAAGIYFVRLRVDGQTITRRKFALLD